MEQNRRLIDAEAAIAEIQNTESEVALNAPYDPEWFTRMADHQSEILEIIERQPTVDAVEVVRCKDCRYSEPCGESQQCLHPLGLYTCDGDDFCSYGERRNNG